MKRLLSSLLLILCLLTGLTLPVLGAELEQAELETTAPSAEDSALPQESAAQTDEDAASQTTATQTDEEIPSQTRAPQSLRTSEAGIAFVNEMMGGSYGGTAQLSNAEYSVNAFCATYGISVTQTQFDALVDLVMAYGGTILTSGYLVERVIGSGSYTDVELANAFCAWVKGTDGNLSQQRLNRRIREIKLFLYGSYSGVCEAAFRYLIFNANGGTLCSNTVLCYPYGGTYASLPTASRSGKYFAGWYTAASGGTHVCNSDAVTQNNTVYAHWSDSAVTDPNEEGSTDPNPDPNPEPPSLKTSEAGVQFIKDHEGFVQYAVWDYSQYSIGYGSACDPKDYPNGITEEEADYLLRVLLADWEKVVDKLLEKSTVEHTQAQYDAIMSFTYNLGQQWMSEKYNTYRYFLYGGYDEMSFVNTIGSWCRAGGSVLSGLSRRRMDEANLYLNGEYTLGTKKYLCISYNGAKGTPEHDFHYYKTGEVLGTLPSAVREGYRLLGWYDKLAGGTEYTAQTIAPSYGTYTLYARWEEGTDTTPNPNPQPTPDPDPQPNVSFTDVPKNAWYYEWVERAVQAGLFSGVSETEFAPEDHMTRAMLVTVLYRMDGEPAVTSTTPFTDVPAGQWYSDAVNWAYACGVVNGVTETRFGLEEDITRQQLTTMLYRYAQYRGEDCTSLAKLDAFADAAEVAEYALKSMQWTVANGIVSGDDGRLLPEGKATRAQCAKMMSVFYDTYVVTE